MQSRRHPGLVVAVTTVATVVVLALVIAILGRVAELDLTFGEITLRSQRGADHPLPAASAPAIGPRELPPAAAEAAVRNVILVIGDGMGIGQVSAASLLLHGADGGLALEAAPVVGLVRTAAADRPVTDSAASATAMATGFKADYRALSVLPDGRRPRTLLEAARQAGMATGVITTSGLADATPAGFLVHVEKRSYHAEVLRQILASGADVLIGGDWTAYGKARRDEGYLSTLADAERLAPEGTTVIRDSSALAGAEPPFVALLPPRPSGDGAYGPDLEVTTRVALDHLAGRAGGFLLLVECELTDELGHANDIAGLVAAVAELDRAVSAVLELASDRDDTLVLVTADHDTGGLGVVSGDRFDDGRARVRWATHDHTAHWVPLFAYGPGAQRFGRVLDNTEIGLELARLLGLSGFPDAG